MPDWQLIEKEYIFTTSKSSGAGGQHVNKVETRVKVCFSIEESKGINQEEKELLLHKYKTRIDKSGVICLNIQSSRSQLENKKEALKRMKTLIVEGLVKPKKRKATRVPSLEKEKRLEQKKTRSKIKTLRKKPDV